MATDLIGPTLESMLACAVAALSPAVGRAAVYPGALVAWDDCCAGQVWVRLISSTPMYPPRSGVGTCGPLAWTVTVGVGSLRCAAVLDDQGDAPPVAALNADSMQETADMAALSEAIVCCISPQVDQLQVLRWDPLGPEGGCVGGEWQFTMLVPSCGCP